MRNSASIPSETHANSIALSFPHPPSFRAAARNPPAKPLALMREETRSKMTRSPVDEFALRAEILRWALNDDHG